MGDGESVRRRLYARTVGARRSTLTRRTVLRLMDNPVLRPMQMLVRRHTIWSSAAAAAVRGGSCTTFVDTHGLRRLAFDRITEPPMMCNQLPRK